MAYLRSPDIDLTGGSGEPDSIQAAVVQTTLMVASLVILDTNVIASIRSDQLLTDPTHGYAT